MGHRSGHKNADSSSQSRPGLHALKLPREADQQVLAAKGAGRDEIEPPMSLPWAIDPIPLATAAADPPLDPPVEYALSQGFLVGPYATGSVVAEAPSSGVLVRPRMANPAPRKRCAR